ncbi:MAG: hypothetical protein J0H38_07575 [Rhizobiales bacterium]|nr:hypothetical protein [Hyphomicrobiales bacterium]
MKWLGVLVIVIVGIVGLFRTAYPSVTVRYHLTLNAVVDGVPKVGSGVIEVSYSKIPQILGSSAEFTIDVQGEAVALDLGSHGTLFALLKEGEDSRSSAEWIVLRAFNLPGGALPSPVEKGVKQVGQLSGKVDLPLKNLPLLVHFRDINDPTTVEKVDPFNPQKTLGPGVELKGASVEIVSAGVWPLSWWGITGERLTRDVDARLTWLSGYFNRRLDGGRFESVSAPNRFANSLSAGSFKAGTMR